MKITATSSGGFAGLTEHYEVDTQAHAQGGTMEAALAHAGFFSRAQAAAQPSGADMRCWRITVDSPEGRHSISFVEDGSAASAPWQELVTRLRRQG